MFDEDLEPQKTGNAAFPRNLENMSIDELKAYIADMQAEIKRVEDDMTKKQASKDAAASVFKS